MKRKVFALLLSFSVIAALVTGCGDDSQKESKDEPINSGVVTDNSSKDNNSVEDGTELGNPDKEINYQNDGIIKDNKIVYVLDSETAALVVDLDGYKLSDLNWNSYNVGNEDSLFQLRESTNYLAAFRVGDLAVNFKYNEVPRGATIAYEDGDWILTGGGDRMVVSFYRGSNVRHTYQSVVGEVSLEEAKAKLELYKKKMAVYGVTDKNYEQAIDSQNNVVDLTQYTFVNDYLLKTLNEYGFRIADYRAIDIQNDAEFSFYFPYGEDGSWEDPNYEKTKIETEWIKEATDDEYDYQFFCNGITVKYSVDSKYRCEAYFENAEKELFIEAIIQAPDAIDEAEAPEEYKKIILENLF